MMTGIKKILIFIRGGWIVFRIYHGLDAETRERLNMDIEDYGEEATASGCIRVMQDSGTKKSFRNVFYFRVKQADSLLVKMCKRRYPAIDSVEIAGDIGGGLKILHSYCVINVGKAGNHLHVCQGCTVGRDGGNPSFGDYVTLLPNSIVVGPITIGDNVMIGAGSFVNKDVPDYAVVAGNPFRILRYNTENKES